MGDVMSVTEAREKLSDLVGRVEYAALRVALTRHGRPVAALVSLQDLHLLEALEDRMDLEEAREALAESDERIPWEILLLVTSAVAAKPSAARLDH